jgi:hypothetical protein
MNDADTDLRTHRAVAAPDWVTPAEASFLARVPLEDVRTWARIGRVEQRPIGHGKDSILLRTIDVLDTAERHAQGLPTLEPPAPRPPVEAIRKRERPRVRSLRTLSGGRVVAATVALVTVVASAVLALLGPGWIRTERGPRVVVPVSAGGRVAAVSQDVVGRDPFVSPFGADRAGSIVVKPPVAIRHGSSLSAAAVVVNQSQDEPLTPTQLVFVAHDATGRIVGRQATVVSLDPGKSTTVVADGIDIGSARPVTLEAKLTDGPVEREPRTEPAAVEILGVRATSDGRAVTGRVDVRSDRPAFQIGCAMFDGDGELAAVGFTTLRDGQRSFSIPTRPVRSGPYDASCFVG